MKDLIEAVTRASDLESDEFNNALADLQNEIGVSDGGWASLFFSGMEEEWTDATLEERASLVRQYISEEEDETIL